MATKPELACNESLVQAILEPIGVLGGNINPPRSRWLNIRLILNRGLHHIPILSTHITDACGKFS